MREVLSGEEVRRERKRHGLTLEGFYMHFGISKGHASQFERGRVSLRPEVLAHIQQFLEDFDAGQKSYKGVPVDWNNVQFTRSVLRKLGLGKKPVTIEQIWGSEYLADWCGRVGLQPHEAGAMFQLKATVTEAEIISAPGQRWLRANVAAVEEVLDGKTFSTYAKQFGSRNEAITALANASFARLLASAGRDKISEYLRALLITGELRAAPRDTDEN